MSRVAKSPVTIPKGVDVTINGSVITVKGTVGTLTHNLNKSVSVAVEENQVTFKPNGDAVDGWTQAGTARALVNNMVTGVSTGFVKKLQLVGVGYRAQAQGNAVNLTLGFSHPVSYQLPEGVTAETPSQTEIVLKSANKQTLGQAAADIRGYRPPEPYKGKGIRYADEVILRKEAKKK
jgi:large subunit ribosomal protein L6